MKFTGCNNKVIIDTIFILLLILSLLVTDVSSNFSQKNSCLNVVKFNFYLIHLPHYIINLN